MARRYWFKAHHHGFGWAPDTWEGFAAFLLYIAGLVYSFFEAQNISHSFGETIMNFLPRFFIFSALLLIIAYLKGEPTHWRWEDKKRDS